MDDSLEIIARKEVNYSDQEKELISLQRDEFNTQYKIGKLKGEKLYENHIDTADKIIKILENPDVKIVMILALTQMGKTGTILAFILKEINENYIPIENIYIITGLSSCHWKQQTKERFPKCLHDNIYHRDELLDVNSNFFKIKGKKNIRLFIDEIQIAAKTDQTIDNIFKDLGYKDPKYLAENNIIIIETTATPNGVIYDRKNFGDNFASVKMTPGANYFSCFYFLRNNRIKNWKDLSFQKNVIELRNYLAKYKGSPRYHLIRVPKSGKKHNEILNNFFQVFSTGFQEEVLFYNDYDFTSSESSFTIKDIKEIENIEDINDLLKSAPEKHTFIFIKEKLRCSKTLHKEYLGILYERYTEKADNSVIIQGLLGRVTGYDVNDDLFIFTDVETIKKYKQVYESCETNIPEKDWISSTSNINGSTGTYGSPSHITISESNNDEEPKYKIFNSLDEAKKFAKDKLGRIIRKTPKEMNEHKDVRGFYQTNMGGWKVKSKQDVLGSFKTNLSDPNKNLERPIYHTLHLCYENINDKDTLRFVITYYASKFNFSE